MQLPWQSHCWAYQQRKPTSLFYGDDVTLGTESQLQPDSVAYTDGTLQGA